MKIQHSGLTLKRVRKVREKKERKECTADRAMYHKKLPPLLSPGLYYRGKGTHDKGYRYWSQQIPWSQVHSVENKKEACPNGEISLIKDGV